MSFKDLFNKIADADRYDYDDDFDEYEEEEAVTNNHSSQASAYDEDFYGSFFQEEPASSKKAPRNTAKRASNTRAKQAASFNSGEEKVVEIHSTAKFAVQVVKPKNASREELDSIAVKLENNISVMLILDNLSNKAVATKVLFYCCGLAKGVKGNFKQITDTNFLLSPYSVDITGDLVDAVSENQFFNNN